MIRMLLFAVALAVGAGWADHGGATDDKNPWSGKKLSREELRLQEEQTARRKSALDLENRTGYHSAYHRAPDMLPRLRAHSDQLGWSDTFDYKVLLLVARAVRAEGHACDAITGAWEAGLAGRPAHNYFMKCERGSRVYQLFPAGVSGQGKPTIRRR